MLVKKDCSICKETHFDHYECSECQYNLGFVNPRINYCPNCGGKLTKRAVDLRQRLIDLVAGGQSSTKRHRSCGHFHSAG